MKVLRTFVCEDCGAATTRRRRADDPMICAPCAQARQDRHNAALKALGAKLRAENKALRAAQPRPARPPRVKPAPAKSQGMLTGGGNSIAEAFADLNRQERERAGGAVH